MSGRGFSTYRSYDAWKADDGYEGDAAPARYRPAALRLEDDHRAGCHATRHRPRCPLCVEDALRRAAAIRAVAEHHAANDPLSQSADDHPTEVSDAIPGF